MTLDDFPTTRRTVLRATAAAVAGGAAGCTGGAPEATDRPEGGSDETNGGGDPSESGTTGADGPASDAGPSSNVREWMDDVSNFGGVADATGAERVTVDVGAEGNGGAYAFDPPAVRVSPGTTVVWKWTGRGGSHNVVAEGGSFESDLSAEEGYSFEHAFERSGAFEYVCEPHEAMGMKGVVVVE
ncbi:halocyanin [Halogeometricum pallidum JCM 14848]|uniref:Halocyanin n=1 Tax=Halogeometricum pallidum JCM 14848 TaxID=1227487 RepID=M0DCU3_HALPD|nr:halocyanin domain-containing protein [Halogeometricum pallidum]ELZ32532.1 halocyanin [Halogeometricum pallidum JCM 14848]